MPISQEKDPTAITQEQKRFIPIQELPPAILERLPDSMFVHLFLSRSRQEVLTPTHWQRLTLEIENVWKALDELAEGTTERLVEADVFYDWELKDIVYAYASKCGTEARKAVDWQGLNYEQQYLQRQAISRASHAQAMQHPAAQELVRRGVKLYDWDEKP